MNYQKPANYSPFAASFISNT